MREVSTFVYGSTPPWARDPFFLKGAGAAVADELSDPARQAQVQASGAYKQGLRYKEGARGGEANLKTLSDAGVRIAMGTDTGPAGRWQGFFEHLELEMMVEAGLTPMQAIVAATGAAARVSWPGRSDSARFSRARRRTARAGRESARRHPQHATDQEHLDHGSAAAVIAPSALALASQKRD